MSLKLFVFDTEAEARRCAEQFGGKASVVYRGDYRHDWLVSVDGQDEAAVQFARRSAALR